MTFDLRASIRRIKPQRRAPVLRRRHDDELSFVGAYSHTERELLLDTSVYADVLHGRTPTEVDDLLQARLVNHSTIALGELTHLLGALDPARPSTQPILKKIEQAIDSIPRRRLSAPSPRAFGEGGMLAGLTARLTGRPHSVALLNDALLFLHAAETGRQLLTGNIRDFDWFDQLLPGTDVLFYR